MVLAVCRVTEISIRISLGRNKTQKELQSFAAARGFLYSHKNIDLPYTPEAWEDKLEAKIEIVRGSGGRYLYRWLSEWFLNIAFAFLRVLCTALPSDLYLFSVRQTSESELFSV